ncbi:interferon alpha/beta receptor 2-like [Gambusia affinis]|uniref:interferon alpha/beta receptor 2-like n=1 Tax=Gambusia affinis TaxID=33528 RepID=UPI001CDB54C0|nr:interferon alpha/beta receptor 2-like [Gambusia affinis]XP_043987620.1 interferon alpha/beta receptor 2-like [Gambusia affinis]XP_043987621.1 interferon alpha/beta receptor 2-like [Gambusia affinis]
MTELLWILTCLPLALTAVSTLPAPINVKVTVDQSGYVLRWEPGVGTPNGTSFNVYTYREKPIYQWVSVCQSVQSPLACNLTKTFGDLLHNFKIKVEAHLGNRTSKSAQLEDYKPAAHLPLPRLIVTSCSNKLCLSFQPPYSRYQETYDNISYDLLIKSSNTKIINIRSLERMENVTDLVPGNDYCVSIRFSYTLYKLWSNFSQPECISVPKVFSSDAVISAVLSLLVMGIIAVFALLFWTGFICLKRRPMPSVLTSISHLEEVKVSSCGDAQSSLLKVRSMAPPGGKRTSSSSEESDEESCTENSGLSSSGANYALHQGANPLSSTSSSSSSLSSASKPKPPPNRTPDSQHEVLVVIEPRPGAEQKLDSLEKRITEEEEAAVNVGQEVNLLTLTFGWPEEEEEEKADEEGCPDVPDELRALAAPLAHPPQPADDAAASYCTDEDEAYDDCDYMCRQAM